MAPSEIQPPENKAHFPAVPQDDFQCNCLLAPYVKRASQFKNYNASFLPVTVWRLHPINAWPIIKEIRLAKTAKYMLVLFHNKK